MKKIYLASPYSHPDPKVREERARLACVAAAEIMRSGHLVLSPIAHSHPIALAGNLPLDFEYWREFDESLIDWCDQVWVLMIDGWMDSKGIKAEVEYAEKTDKFVYHYRMTTCEM